MFNFIKETTGDMQDSDNENDLYSERSLFHTRGESGAEIECESGSYFPLRSIVFFHRRKTQNF